MSQSPDLEENREWTGRVVILDDESTAYENLKDWLHEN